METSSLHDLTRRPLLRRALPALLAAAGAAVAGPAAAQEVWTGAISTDWFANGNWQDGSAPTLGESVQIETLAPNATVIDGATGSAADLTIGLTGVGSLTVTDSGDLLVGGVTVGANGAFTLGDNADVEIGSLSGSGAVVLGDFSALAVVGTASTTFSGAIVGDGDFSYDGDGTLTLTGDSAITGALSTCGCGTGGLVIDGGSFVAESMTDLSGGSLEIRNGGSFETLDLALDSATLTVHGSGSSATVTGGTYVGFVGPGRLLVTDGGLLASLGDAELDSVFGASEASVTGAGSRWDVDGSLFVGAGSFGGVGSLTVADGGLVTADLVLVGPGSTLFLGDGGLAGGVETSEIVNDGEIFADFTDTLSLDAEISGVGGLVKSGSGTLILNGDGRYTDTTEVRGGLLVVNGNLAAPVVVDPGGALGGGGSLLHGVVSAGTIAPGNSVGTLTVAGDAVFLPGSVYEVEVVPDGTGSDLLHVLGEAEIDGGRVRHVGPAGGYRESARYRILTADGGVQGRFDAVESDFAFLDPSLGYDTNNVYLTLERNDVPFEDIAETDNHATTGESLESLTPGHGVYEAIIVLGEEDALEAYDALSGELHANVSGTLIEESRLLREVPTGRLRQAFAQPGAPVQHALAGASDVAALPAPPEGVTPWAQAFGAWGKRDSDGNAAAVDHVVGGVLFGADAPLSEVWRLGLFTGYDRREITVEDRRSSSSVDTVHLGAYAGADLGAIGIALGAAYSWHAIDSEREVAFTGFRESLEAEHGASTAQLFAEASYALAAGPLALEPFVAAAYVRSDSDAFTEGGGEAALAVEENDHSVGYGTLGLRGAAPLRLDGVPPLTAFGSLGWRHAFGELSPDGTATLNDSEPFTLQGLSLARDAALIDAGLAARLGRASALQLSYSGQIGDGYQDHGLQLTFAMEF